MAKALVSPNETVQFVSGSEQKYVLDEKTGQAKQVNVPVFSTKPNSARIAEVVQNDSSAFTVAAPFFWANATNGVTPETHYYDTATNQIVAM